LFVDSILYSFYKNILIVLRTINTDIYLEFRIFDAIFNYFQELKKIIEIRIYFSTDIVVKTCYKISNKFAKYYSKTEKSDNILYNIVNILNSTEKISFYKT